jgi:hypothetical protein
MGMGQNALLRQANQLNLHVALDPDSSPSTWFQHGQSADAMGLVAIAWAKWRAWIEEAKQKR